MNDETKGNMTSPIYSSPELISEDMRTQPNESTEQKKDRGYIDWFTEGMEHSGVVTALSNWLGDSDPFSDKEDLELTREQIREIYEKVNWSDSAFKVVTRGLKDMADVDQRVQRVNENLAFQDELSKAGFIEGIVAGVGDAIVDPANYLGAYATRGMGLLGRVVIGGSATNVASGQIREELSGADTDILQDAVAGAVFAGVFEGASKGFNMMGDANRRFQYKQNQMRLGLPISKDVLKNLGGNSSTAPYMDRAREWLNEAFPAIQVSEVLYRNEATKDLASRIFRRNQGTLKEVDGELVNVEVNQATPTIEERLQVENNALWEFQTQYADTKAKMMQLGMTDEEFNLTMYNLLEGRLHTDTDLVNVAGKGHKVEPEMIELAKKYRSMMDTRGNELLSRGFLSNLKKNYGAPRVMDKVKVFNFMRRLQEELRIFDDDDKIRIKAIERVANNLVAGARKNRNTLKELYDRYVLEFKASKSKGITSSKNNAPNTKNAVSTEVWEVPAIDSKEFDAWLKENAHKDAIGYIDQNEHSYGIDGQGQFIAKYDHERLAWDTSYVDERGFSLDSLRLDASDVMRNYWNHTAGDIVWYDELGLMGYENVSNYMQNLSLKRKLSTNKREDSKLRRALKTTLNLTYGISPKDHYIGKGVSNYEACLEILRNMTFFTKNGFMGILNHTEVAEGIRAYGSAYFLRSVPWVRNKFKNWSQGHYTNEDITAINNSIFGEEVKSLGIFSNSWEETKARAKVRYQEIERRNKDRYDAVGWLRKTVSATQWLSEVSPATRYLQHSQRSIVDEARSQFMGELVRTAHGLKKGHKGFFNDKDLKRNSISEAQATHLVEVIKSCTKVNKDGSIQFTNIDKLYKDTGAMLTLRRMGDYVSNNVTQRNTMGDAFYWADVNNPMLDLLFQFKTFAVNSWTKRALRMVNRGFEGEREAVEQLLTFSISGGLATFGHIGNTYIKAYGIQDEEKRKKYLERQLGSTEGIFDLDSDVALTAIWNGGFQRNGILAFPALLLASIPYIGNREAKTTTSIAQTDDEGKPLKSFSIENYLGDMIPAFGTFDSGVNTLIHAYDMINMDDYTPEEQDRVRRNLKRATTNLAPNYPLVTPFILSLFNNEEK